VWVTPWEQASREIDAEEAESSPGTTAGAENGSAEKDATVGSKQADQRVSRNRHCLISAKKSSGPMIRAARPSVNRGNRDRLPSDGCSTSNQLGYLCADR
jgi:hypothetical protein